MKITIAKTELEFSYNFTKLTTLMKQTGSDLSTLGTVMQDIQQAPLIGSLGTGKTIEEITALLDKGDFGDVTEILEAFGQEVVRYIPNVKKAEPLSN